MKTSMVHSYKVMFEENAHEGVRHLEDHLDYKEAKVLFDSAREHRSAEFEDNANRNYTLIYSNGSYVVVRR